MNSLRFFPRVSDFFFVGSFGTDPKNPGWRIRHDPVREICPEAAPIGRLGFLPEERMRSSR
jgi:hypothetical protein